MLRVKSPRALIEILRNRPFGAAEKENGWGAHWPLARNATFAYCPATNENPPSRRPFKYTDVASSVSTTILSIRNLCRARLNSGRPARNASKAPITATCNVTQYHHH